MEQLRSVYGGERPTLRPLFLSLILPALAVPAMAQNAKQDVEKLAAAYQQCVNKHDPAWVASLYSNDGVQVNPGGVFPDIKAVYEQNFMLVSFAMTKIGDDSRTMFARPHPCIYLTMKELSYAEQRQS